MNNEKTTSKKTSKRSSKDSMSLLQAIERIVDASNDSKLSDQFMRDNKAPITFLAEKFGITPVQAVLFSICLEYGQWSTDYADLARHLDVSRIRAYSYGNDIEALVKRRIVRFNDIKKKNSFMVPESVIIALRKNEVYTQAAIDNLTCDNVFEILDEWFESLNAETLSIDQLSEDLIDMLTHNRQLVFCQSVLDLHLNSDNLLLLILFCHLLVNIEDDRIVNHQIEGVCRTRRFYNRTKSELKNGCHNLMNLGLIEHVCEDGVANTSMYHLTDKAKRDLLPELNITKAEVKLANVLPSDKIVAKHMYYPTEMEKQIAELNEFFEDEQFVKIQQRMQESGFRTGFACLFYGGPGTGKTETAYQLARATGRSIMTVDVPEIKSKWVGDSEKNIKALFDRYRLAVNRSKVAPILLFNEADAIIGVRKSGAENAVDKMENTIQNIILQEMETMNGIMIATTNLVGNLDSAFERRFLYKVKFEKPDAKVRRCIWQAMIPALSDTEAQTLADSYDLSGGQIENVARKDTINHILHGDEGDHLATLMDYCKDETLQSSTRRTRVGY